MPEIYDIIEKLNTKSNFFQLWTCLTVFLVIGFPKSNEDYNTKNSAIHYRKLKTDAFPIKVK
ncbi:MAG: hypothetical protein ACI8P3_003092 [Saprospiraceae bacterium]|jgi:hypothetical protein